MSLRSVWIIPFLTFALSLLAFLVPYCIAVYNKHVDAFWPYISDSGAMSPESCVFGQLLNIAALFLAMTVYLRHRQIVEFYWHGLGQKGAWRIYSNVFLWIGLSSAAGASIVANFQEINVIVMHYVGAFLAFTCGLFYLWAQTIFSYVINPSLTSRWLCHFRLFLCVFTTAAYVNTLVFASLARAEKGTDADAANCTLRLFHWKRDHPLYTQHTIATISEWALATCFQLYILSFAVELRHAYCHAPKLKLNKENIRSEQISATSSSTEED